MERPYFEAAVIGGGVVGLWATLDLVTRGIPVILLERGMVGGETSGKFHGLLHSGARYAVVDPVTAEECYRENQLLSKIVPQVIEDTGGYYVALTESDERYYDQFAEALKRVGIPFREVPVSEALREEPKLNPNARLVVEVPDKVIYARELAATLAYVAHRNFATIVEGVEVVKIEKGPKKRAIITIKDRLTDKTMQIEAEVILNAAGPWAAKIAKMVGIDIQVALVAGAVLVFGRRFTRRVINRLRKPSDGDIIVPYGNLSLAGTTAYPVKSPEEARVREEDLDIIYDEAAKLIPEIEDLHVLRAYASVRALVPRGNEPRAVPRSFDIIVTKYPVKMVTVVGGKLTTARLVAEKAADAVARLLRSRAKSKTARMRLDVFDPFEEIEKSPFHRHYAKLFASTLKESMDAERARLAALLLLEYEANMYGRYTIGLEKPDRVIGLVAEDVPIA